MDNNNIMKHMYIYIYIHIHIYKYVNQQTHHEQLASKACGGTTKNHRRRNSSLLEHIIYHQVLKKLQPICQRSKTTTTTKISITTTKTWKWKEKYNHHNKRGTISMAEFKEMNSNNRLVELVAVRHVQKVQRCLNYFVLQWNIVTCEKQSLFIFKSNR